MKVFDLFSKRQKRNWDKVPDVYQYETIPKELRVQIVHVIRDAFGDLDTYSGHSRKAFRFIHEALCREYGVFGLGDKNDSDYEIVLNFLIKAQDIEEVIDVVEITFRIIDISVRENKYDYNNCQLSPDEAIAELNYRLREHGVGYQYESGKIIRVDSQLIHAEVVRPALTMLSDPIYKGANSEYLSAHEHYRAQKYKECLNDCLKAFESTMKSICTQRRWDFNTGDTAKRLIEIIFEKKLIQIFMQAHFTALRSSLESGVPTVRNKMSGHGQGVEVLPVPEFVAAYALHLTASNILFLTKANAEMK